MDGETIMDDNKTEFHFCTDPNCDGADVMEMMLDLCKDYYKIQAKLTEAVQLLEDIADGANDDSH